MSMSISEASTGRLTATGWLASSCRWWVLLVAAIFSSTPLLASRVSLIELQRSPSQKIILKGHTDSTHTKVYNLELLLRRAQTVMEWLIGNGVDASRLEAKGYGEFRPVADNSTEEGRALNRRVEISLQ